MKILNLTIKNFRSINGEELNIPISNGLNIIIGENNSGKSNILTAINYLKSFCTNKKVDFKINDYHNGVWNNYIEISILIEIDENELDDIVNSLIIENKLSDHDSTRNWFKDQLRLRYEIHVKKIQGNYMLYVKKGNLYLSSIGGSLNLPIQGKGGYPLIHLGDIYKKIISEKSTLENNQYLDPNVKETKYIEELRRVYDRILFYFSSNLDIFSDFRQKPIWKDTSAIYSYDGVELKNVLYNLYNNPERAKFDRYNSILKEFNRLFPNLRFRAVNGDLHIIKEPSNFEVSLDLCGAGIIEMLTFLTNVVDSSDKVVGLEEPELHLHPHTQRVLLDIINKNSENNQFIILTHSPYFISPKYINQHILVRDINGVTQAFRLPEDYFTEKEISKLEKNIDISSKDMFFSKCVLLTEGETELGAFPIFAKEIGVDFDANGISAIFVGGKDNFEIFVKLLEGFNIPYIIVCDKDAVLEIGSNNLPSLIRQVNCQPVNGLALYRVD